MIPLIQRRQLLSTPTHRVALITGGAGALGRAIAARLARDKVRVVLADLDAASCEQVVSHLEHGAFSVHMDVTSAASIGSAVQAVLAKAGRIDILVNNAGVLVREDHSEMDEKVFDRILEVNLKGPFLVTKALIPVMKEQRYGRLVGVASRNSLVGGMPAYGASKAGLEALTVSWARELGPYGVTANCVAPSPIAITPGLGLVKRTPEEQLHSSRHLIGRTPIARLATRDDVAGAVAYFASEEAGFVTGETLYVAGGSQLAPLSVYPTDAK
jgi:3-oxoacyl-[acyl-carrier protein] reductase